MAPINPTTVRVAQADTDSDLDELDFEADDVTDEDAEDAPAGAEDSGEAEGTEDADGPEDADTPDDATAEDSPDVDEPDGVDDDGSDGGAVDGSKAVTTDTEKKDAGSSSLVPNYWRMSAGYGLWFSNDLNEGFGSGGFGRHFGDSGLLRPGSLAYGDLTARLGYRIGVSDSVNLLVGAQAGLQSVSGNANGAQGYGYTSLGVGIFAGLDFKDLYSNSRDWIFLSEATLSFTKGFGTTGDIGQAFPDVFPAEDPTEVKLGVSAVTKRGDRVDFNAGPYLAFGKASAVDNNQERFTSSWNGIGVQVSGSVGTGAPASAGCAQEKSDIRLDLETIPVLETQVAYAEQQLDLLQAMVESHPDYGFKMPDIQELIFLGGLAKKLKDISNADSNLNLSDQDIHEIVRTATENGADKSGADLNAVFNIVEQKTSNRTLAERVVKEAFTEARLLPKFVKKRLEAMGIYSDELINDILVQAQANGNTPEAFTNAIHGHIGGQGNRDNAKGFGAITVEKALADAQKKSVWTAPYDDLVTIDITADNMDYDAECKTIKAQREMVRDYRIKLEKRLLVLQTHIVHAKILAGLARKEVGVPEPVTVEVPTPPEFHTLFVNGARTNFGKDRPNWAGRRNTGKDDLTKLAAWRSDHEDGPMNDAKRNDLITLFSSKGTSPTRGKGHREEWHPDAVTTVKNLENMAKFLQGKELLSTDRQNMEILRRLGIKIPGAQGALSQADRDFEEFMADHTLVVVTTADPDVPPDLTPEQGAEYNRQLTIRRSTEIKEVLAELGVKNDIIAYGYGSLEAPPHINPKARKKLETIAAMLELREVRYILVPNKYIPNQGATPNTTDEGELDLENEDSGE